MLTKVNIEKMKNKKIIILFTILFLIIVIGGYFILNQIKKDKEETMQDYTPQEEITDEQFRQTIVSLYFLDKENNQISPEARLVDIKEMINLPYEKLINLLIEGPKNEKLKSVIPDQTKILKTYTEGDCLTIDFSQEFLNYDKTDPNQKQFLIDSIVDTVTELTEINQVKILIQGAENQEFKEIYTRK